MIKEADTTSAGFSRLVVALAPVIGLYFDRIKNFPEDTKLLKYERNGNVAGFQK